MVNTSKQASAEGKILLLYHKEDDREANIQLGSSYQAEEDTTSISTTITKCSHLFESKGKYLFKNYLVDCPKIHNINM